MLYSAEGEQAAKGISGHCPYCGETLIPKCGDIMIHHWAHRKRDACDEWFEAETDWHLQWKLELSKRLPQSDVKVEYVLTQDEKRHIADLYCANSHFVIELQHSPLPLDALLAREAFYGRMMWIVDVGETDRHGNIRKVLKQPPADYVGYQWFRWQHLRPTWAHATAPVLLDGFRDVYLTLGVDGIQQGFWAKKLPRAEFLENLVKHLKEWRACIKDSKLPLESKPLLEGSWYRVRLNDVSAGQYRTGAALMLMMETVETTWGRQPKPYRFEVFAPFYLPQVCLPLLEIFLGLNAEGVPLPEALELVRSRIGECFLAHVSTVPSVSAGGKPLTRNKVIALKDLENQY